MRRSVFFFAIVIIPVLQLVGCAHDSSSRTSTSMTTSGPAAPVVAVDQTTEPPLPEKAQPLTESGAAIADARPIPDANRTLSDKIQDPKTPQQLLDTGTKPVEMIPPASRPPEIIALSDDKILKVAQVANQGEIEAAKMASARAATPEVRQFAKMMVEHHATSQRRTVRVASLLNLQPAASPAAEDLRVDSEKKMDSLRDKTGVAFDRAYLATQIEAHQNVLQLIDNRLVPEAKEASVKALVRDMRPVVAKHLGEAISLQEKIGK